jgi:hypothetical protein
MQNAVRPLLPEREKGAYLGTRLHETSAHEPTIIRCVVDKTRPPPSALRHSKLVHRAAVRGAPRPELPVRRRQEDAFHHLVVVVALGQAGGARRGACGCGAGGGPRAGRPQRSGAGEAPARAVGGASGRRLGGEGADVDGAGHAKDGAGGRRRRGRGGKGAAVAYWAEPTEVGATWRRRGQGGKGAAVAYRAESAEDGAAGRGRGRGRAAAAGGLAGAAAAAVPAACADVLSCQ